MKMATDSARHRMPFGRVALIPLIMVSWCFSSGCASLTSPGAKPSTLARYLWNRSGETSAEPGYDQYAMAAAAAHPNVEQELAAARQEARPRATNPLENPSRTELLAQSEKARARDRSGSRTGRTDRTRTVDSGIRVTLGRPEGLQTINDQRPAPSEEALASVPVTNWKQAEASPRHPSPDLKPDPEPDRTNNVASARGSTSPSRPVPKEETPRSLLAEAQRRLNAVSSYQVVMNRAERVGGQIQTEEDVLLSIRRKPKAVRLEWTSGPSKGREVIYSAAINDRTMYVNMADSSLPIPRMSIPVDSPLALRNSRHPITEAGFETILGNLMKYANPETVDTARDGKLTYKGLQPPRGMTERCHLLERVTPKGETWQVYLDARTLMPVLVSAVQTRSGELIERYSYRDLKLNPADLTLAEAFDPDKRWGESKSWLSRLARAAASAPANASSGTATTR